MIATIPDGASVFADSNASLSQLAQEIEAGGSSVLEILSNPGQGCSTVQTTVGDDTAVSQLKVVPGRHVVNHSIYVTGKVSAPTARFGSNLLGTQIPNHQIYKSERVKQNRPLTILAYLLALDRAPLGDLTQNETIVLGEDETLCFHKNVLSFTMYGLSIMANFFIVRVLLSIVLKPHKPHFPMYARFPMPRHTHMYPPDNCDRPRIVIGNEEEAPLGKGILSLFAKHLP